MKSAGHAALLPSVLVILASDVGAPEDQRRGRSMPSRIVSRRTGQDLPDEFARAARLARRICHVDAHPASSVLYGGKWTLRDFAGRYIADVTNYEVVVQEQPTAIRCAELPAVRVRRTTYFRCPCCGQHFAAPDFDGLDHAAVCPGASIALLDLEPDFVRDKP